MISNRTRVVGCRWSHKDSVQYIVEIDQGSRDDVAPLFYLFSRKGFHCQRASYCNTDSDQTFVTTYVNVSDAGKTATRLYHLNVSSQ